MIGGIKIGKQSFANSKFEIDCKGQFHQHFTGPFQVQFLSVQIPKAQKDIDGLTEIFMLQGSSKANAACKMLVKFNIGLPS